MINLKQRIVLVREPVSGLLEIHRLYGMVKSQFEPKADDDLYVVFYTKSYRRLKILHVNATGYDLTTRLLYKGQFGIDGSSEATLELTKAELYRLMFDGSLPNTPWINPLSELVCPLGVLVR